MFWNFPLSVCGAQLDMTKQSHNYWNSRYGGNTGNEQLEYLFLYLLFSIHVISYEYIWTHSPISKCPISTFSPK